MTKRKETYLENKKKKKVGETCICPICGEEFVKKQYAQAFDSVTCKDRYWNDKKDRHREGYHKEYNMKHPERLERVGIYEEGGKFGHYDEDGNFWSFEEEAGFYGMCENPIEGR